MLVNTWDFYEGMRCAEPMICAAPVVRPISRCTYNFQALQSNSEQVPVGRYKNLHYEVMLKVRDDGTFQFDPTNAPANGTDESGCGNEIEMGSEPWVHVIMAASFTEDAADGTQCVDPVARTGCGWYVLELVPFWAAGLLKNNYPEFTKFPGNNKPYDNNHPAQLDRSNPNTGGGIGGGNDAEYDQMTNMLTKPAVYVARIAITDERVRPYVRPNATALGVGEQRLINVDLKGVFGAIFPGVDINRFTFNGGWVGTEQFNKVRIGLDIRKWSFIAS